MATVELTRYVDDVTGDEIDPDEVNADVPLSFGSEAWVLDLSVASRLKIREALEPFVANARRVKPLSARGQVPGQRKTTRAEDRAASRAIRNWLMENWEALGMAAPSVKGRIPADAVAAYQRHGGQRVETGPPAKKRASSRRKNR